MNDQIKNNDLLNVFTNSLNGVHDFDTSEVNLPSSARLKPVSTPTVVSSVKTLLQPDSIHAVLLYQWLKPTMSDKATIQPANYDRALGALAQRALVQGDNIDVKLKRRLFNLVETMKAHRLFVTQRITSMLDS